MTIMHQNEAILTIFILAYENSECVRKMLLSIRPSISEDFIVVIVDNSDQTEDVNKIYIEYSRDFQDRLLYFKNRYNIGPLASIMRSFEIAITPYIWIVGACNQINDNSISLIINILKSSSPDCLMIYEDNLWRKQFIQSPKLYSDWKSVLSDHSYSVLCSINSMIYKISKFNKFLDIGYEASSSLVPHTAMILEGLRTKQISLLYAPIYAIQRPIRERVWSTRKFIRNLTSVFAGHVPEIEQIEFLQVIAITDEWIHKEIHQLTNDPNYGYTKKK
jgi:hypothetical protein